VNSNNSKLAQEIDELLQSVKGKTLGGRYIVSDILGIGGMSVVLLGRDILTNSAVALKTLKPSLNHEPFMVARFQQEIISLGKLDHPNVIGAQDCVSAESGQPFIVMEYLHGLTLEDLIKQQGRLPLPRINPIFQQVCLGLKHAHDQGVIHKDLKPANIMLVPDGRKEVVKLFDFGLAKVLEEEPMRRTAKGTVVGSAAYMSPEQCHAENEHSIDERSDVYQIGAVMYEAFTGRVPFYQVSNSEILNKHICEYPPAFKTVIPEDPGPPLFEAVVFIAMAKAPEQRFQNMNELKAALDAVFNGSTAVQESLLKRRRQLV
jgi:serine/threonine protein kinase